MQMQSKLCKRYGDGGGGILSLPEDNLSEVLLRLPAKDLRRCRCVCKGWRTLISDPAFHAVRRSRGGAGPLIIALFGSAPEVQLRLQDDVGNVFRVFNVRAPALLAPTRLDLIFIDRMHLGAMIINPASGRDFTVLGTSDPQPTLPSWCTLSTWTDMSDYSFGRAVPSGDYKVLRFRLIETSSSSHWRYGGRCRSRWCEVAMIVNDGAEPRWRRRPWGPFYDTSCFSCDHKATVNGDLYFMVWDTYSESNGRNLIATFNLESEEWKAKTVKGPPLGRKNDGDKWRTALTQLKGTLCMVHNVQHLYDFGGNYANIWLLKDPNRSVWIKDYKIQMPERLLFTKPLDVMLDGTLLILNMFQKAGNDEKYHQYILQFYNCSTKVFTDFMEMAEGFNGRMAFYTGSVQS